MFNKNKIRSMEDNIDQLFFKVRELRNEIKNSSHLSVAKTALNNLELRKDLDTLRDLSVISDKLFSDMITDVDRKYKAVFTLILDHLKLDLNLNEDGQMYVEKRRAKASSKRGSTNNKTKTKTAKVGEKNSSVRGKTSRKRK